MSIVNENSKLKSEVEQLEAELGSQLTLHKQELEDTEKTITSLMTRQAADEAAIAGLMTTIQELREESSKSEARAVSLGKEVEDSNRELTEAAAKIDQLVGVSLLHLLSCYNASAQAPQSVYTLK